MKQSLLFLFTFFLSSAVYAQIGDLSGIVTDHNGNPVAGAGVMLKEINRTTATDDSGKYVIKSVKYGNYTLVIRSVVTESKSLAVKIDNANTIVNPRVKGNAETELKQVTVEGKTEKRKIETSGFAVNW